MGIVMPSASRTHKVKKRYEQDRASAAERGYGWRWQRASERYRRANPLCAECARRGITRSCVGKEGATDHIVPHRGDMKLFWDRDNWQGLCVPCHNAKSATERWGGGVK